MEYDSGFAQDRKGKPDEEIFLQNFPRNKYRRQQKPIQVEKCGVSSKGSTCIVKIEKRKHKSNSE